MIWLYHNVDLGRKKTLSPFQKLNDLYLFKVKSPSPKGAFWLKLADSFLRRKYLNFVNVSFFSYFTIIFPWKRMWTFIWINLNPLHQTMLCAILVEIGVWFWRRILFKFVNIFFLFPYYLPLQKGHGPSFEKILIPFTQGCFVSSLVEIGPMVLEKKMKMSKVYRQRETKRLDVRD